MASALELHWGAKLIDSINVAQHNQPTPRGFLDRRDGKQVLLKFGVAL